MLYLHTMAGSSVIVPDCVLCGKERKKRENEMSGHGFVDENGGYERSIALEKK